jgi:8-oxo-dGTP diphosphatase
MKVVNAIILNQDKTKFLVIKRKNGIHKGKWAFPGGIVEENESNIKALKREVKEETNLDFIKVLRKIGSYEYSRGDNSKTYGTSYLALVKDFNVHLDSESSQFKWVTLEEFEKLDHITGLDEEARKALFS